MATTKKNLSVLVIKTHSLYQETPEDRDKYVSAVDAWRTVRPMELLREKTDWNIDIKGEWIPFDWKVNEPRLQKYVDKLGKKYDLIFSSYTRQGMQYGVIDYLVQNHGVKFVMDIDDDLFNLASWNPAYEAWKRGTTGRHYGETIVEIAPNLTTTTKPLAKAYRKLREGLPRESVTVIPNFISKAFYGHPGAPPDDKIIIGWHGSAHHKGDLELMWPAIKRIMDEFPKVHLHTVHEQPPDGFDRSRVRVYPTKRDMNYWYNLHKRLGYHIGVAPLEDTTFNRGKSNIKWQEYALMEAAPVCSQVYPYLRSVENGVTGLLVNDAGWYDALKDLVSNPDKRKQIAMNAKREVEQNWLLEENWQVYRDYFEGICA